MDEEILNQLQDIYGELQWYLLNLSTPIGQPIEHFERTVIRALNKLASMDNIAGLQYVASVAVKAVDNFDMVEDVVNELESLGIGDEDAE